jgi:2,3-bisphosphoglycerate-independent phosphoglycerate mutase
MKRKVILMIIDGFGQGEQNIGNPFRFSKTPNLNYFKKFFPFCLLNAHGYAVGLPPDEAASCEIGHLTIGSGIVYYQPKVKIDLLIESKDFFKNSTLNNLFEHAKKFKSRVHLVGLLSESSKKSSFEHLLALLRKAKEEKFNEVYLHLFADGVESPPKSALNLIQRLLKEKEGLPGKIATLCGRFYALDETMNYKFRTQRAFLLIVEGIGNLADDPLEFLTKKYQAENFNDSILEPTIFLKEGIVKDNDAVFFFNYENTSIFQLANAFLNPNFQEFKRPKRENLFIASMTKYLENLDYPVLFESPKIKTNLTRIITDNKLKQLKIIDEPRKKLLSFYFNGFFEEEHPGEVYKTVPSFEDSFDNLIQRTEEAMNYLKLSLKEGLFDFIVISLPTFEIVGQKGNFSVATQVIEKMDEILGEVYEVVNLTGYTLIITSDHGNIEKLIDISKGEKETAHNTSPVPFYLIDKNFKREKTKEEMSFFEKKVLGSLVDIAPTILDLFGIKPPPDFDGKSLLKYF